MRWLQDAESFFTAVDAAAAAKRCRDLLRDLGLAVLGAADSPASVPIAL